MAPVEFELFWLIQGWVYHPLNEFIASTSSMSFFFHLIPIFNDYWKRSSIKSFPNHRLQNRLANYPLFSPKIALFRSCLDPYRRPPGTATRSYLFFSYSKEKTVQWREDPPRFCAHPRAAGKWAVLRKSRVLLRGQNSFVKKYSHLFLPNLVTRQSLFVVSTVKSSR